jgi:UMF1 family MFS transporter
LCYWQCSIFKLVLNADSHGPRYDYDYRADFAEGIAIMSTATAASESPVSAQAPERIYNRRVRAWALYDWADHAYITVTSSTFFPPYFIAIAAPAFLEAAKAASDPQAQARDTASNIFAFATALALLIAALLAPVLGAYADLTGRRKRLLIVCTLFGAVVASLMVTLTTGLWLAGLIMYGVTQVILNIAFGLNSSLLPHVARPEDVDRVSSFGYAMGYVGGGLLLLVDTALYLFADKLGIETGTAVRIVFFSVGVWWLAFMLPMVWIVPEPPATPLAHGSIGNPIRDAFTRIRHTLRDAQRYRELFKMLVAFWLYSEGIGAIILLATAYGSAVGLDTSALIGALLMTQFVAFPYALVYGRIADKGNSARASYVAMLVWTAVTMPIVGVFVNLNHGVPLPVAFALIAIDQIAGIAFAHFVGGRLFAAFTDSLDTKRAIVFGLVIYMIIPIWGFFLHSAAEFFMIGYLVGTVQGGTQALSRSLYARLCPRAKSGEFFGLYGLSEKFAGILGPLLYGIVGTLTHSPQDSVLSVDVFFLLGMFLLWRVNETAGAAVAQAEEQQIELVHVAD